MRFLLLFMLTLATNSVFAKLSKSNWEIQSGTLTYHVSYPLKSVEGISKNVRGKGRCDSNTCTFLVAVPVKSFESGDGNRDNHMLEVTKAALNPMLTVKARFSEELTDESFDMNLEVTFAGKTHTYEHVKVKAQLGENEAVTRGVIPLMLSDFGIERPSLLTVKIDDSTPVDFELKWR